MNYLFKSYLTNILSLFLVQMLHELYQKVFLYLEIIYLNSILTV